jgi:hypothetical protein
VSPTCQHWRGRHNNEIPNVNICLNNIDQGGSQKYCSEIGRVCFLELLVTNRNVPRVI